MGPRLLTSLVMGIGAAAAIGAVAAIAATAPGWNSGYGWWPGGYGYPPVTARAHGYPCSLTVYGPTFTVRGGGWRQQYGGGTRCRPGGVVKSIVISDQVLGADGHTWYALRGSTRRTGPIGRNPLRASRRRPAYLGHVYRAAARARLTIPNGHAGCSLTHTCLQTIVLTATSRPLAP